MRHDHAIAWVSFIGLIVGGVILSNHFGWQVGMPVTLIAYWLK